MIVLLALGCGGTPIPATTVQGVQVVAIETFPPNPVPTEQVRIKVWVADALGLGADVLVWMCTPVLGTCVEAWLPGTDGMPLDLWTATGTTDRTFEIVRPWPWFHDLTVGGALEAAGGSGGLDVELPFDLPEGAPPALYVWALACVPGRCPTFDAVRASPVAGSDAWRAVVSELAEVSDPLAGGARMLEGVPPHQASIAVKEIPLWEAPDLFTTTFAPTEPLAADAAPVLSWRAPWEVREVDTGIPAPASSVAPALATVRSVLVDELQWFDPDGDLVAFQAFTTRGVVEVSTFVDRPGLVYVTRRPTVRGELGEVFLVGEDGRGGTVVWDGGRDVSGLSGACADEPSVKLLRPNGTVIDDWESLTVSSAFPLYARLSGLEGDLQVVTRLVSDDGRVLADGDVRARVACGGGTPETFLVWNGPKGPCGRGGELVTLETTVEASPPLVVSKRVVLALTPDQACAE